MPAAKKKPKKKPAARARRSSSPRGLPTLDQRQLDLIGLGLVGLGLFFGFLVYAGWEGGQVGSQAVEALKWLLGAAHYLVPVALVAGGAIVVLRPVLPAVRPFRSGAICLFLAVTLALSAGTLGVGPEGVRPDWWDAEWVKTRGGMVGETFDWGLETLFGAVGAHIVAIFLFIAGVLLLTGASVASVIKFTSDSVSSTTRELRTAAAKAPRPRPRPRVRDDLATLERSTRVKVSTKAPPAEIEEPREYDALWDSEIEAVEPLEPAPRSSASPMRAGASRRSRATPSPNSTMPEPNHRDRGGPRARAARRGPG